MLGTSEEQRFFGPGGSQTQPHHNSNSNNQQASTIPHIATHPTTAYPPFYSPYSHLQHLAALHTSVFGANNLNTSDLLLNQTNVHASNLWPVATNDQYSHSASLNAASSGRISAFDFHSNNQGEFIEYFPH